MRAPALLYLHTCMDNDVDSIDWFSKRVEEEFDNKTIKLRSKREKEKKKKKKKATPTEYKIH